MAKCERLFYSMICYFVVSDDYKLDHFKTMIYLTFDAFHDSARIMQIKMSLEYTLLIYIVMEMKTDFLS